MTSRSSLAGTHQGVTWLAAGWGGRNVVRRSECLLMLPRDTGRREAYLGTTSELTQC